MPVISPFAVAEASGQDFCVQVAMIKNAYWFYAAIARKVLAAMDRGETGVKVSVDLNLSMATFPLAGEELILDVDNRLSRTQL
jgi:hypothetical protein